MTEPNTAMMDQPKPSPVTVDDAIKALLEAASAWRTADALIRACPEAKALVEEHDYPAYNYLVTNGHQAMLAADRLARILRREWKP